MKPRKWLPILASLTILTILILLSDFKELYLTMKGANPIPIAIGIGLWGIGALLRNVRWRYLLKKIGVKSPFLTTLKIYVISMFVSNLTPAKTGDPIRSILLKKYTGPTFSATVSSVIIERVIEIIVLVIIGLFAILFLPKTEISGLVLISSGIYILGILLILSIMFSEKKTVSLTRFIHKLFSFIPKIKEIEEKLISSARMISISTKKYGKPGVIINTTILTAIIWLVELIIIYLAFYSVGIRMPLWIIALITPIIILVSILTLLPGGVGSAEAISVILYGSIYNIEISTILAAMLIGRFMSYGMYMIVGSLSISSLGKVKKYV